MYCIHCGVPVNAGCEKSAAQPPVENKTNTLAIVGFIFAFIMPLIGLICSIIGYKQADKDFGGAQKGFALAGTIISAVYLAVIFLIIIAVFAIVLIPIWALA